MTLIVDHYHIPPDKDKRRKIPDEEHAYIIKRHKDGEAIRAISRAYNVDKRLIQFIIYPERQITMYKARLKRRGSKQYYNKDEWKLIMQKHRAYKKKLLGQNALLKNPKSHGTKSKP